MTSISTRKLSVVLFADIQGYTSMMQQNESKALDIIHKFKEVVEKTIPEFNGDIIQYYGDGCLTAFESCTQSVECAIAMQERFNKNLKVPVRIGLHLGEVVFENENAYGDGVNIASRIQSLGIPGSILLSKSIRDQIKNKDEFQLKLLGSFEFKNLSEPIKVYAIVNSRIAIPTKNDLIGKSKISTSRTKVKWMLGAIGIFLLLFVGYKLVWPGSDNSEGPALLMNKMGQSYILSIGVDNNPNWLKLSNAKNDAIGVGEVLKNYYGFKDLLSPLINEEATGDNIRDAIKNARNILKEDDELVVFFAGHGHSDIIEEGANDFPTGYIIPYDGEADNSKSLNSYIKIEDFLKEISDLPALHITTIFDACYSGFSMGDDLLVYRGGASVTRETMTTKSRKVFSSAEYDQKAVDNGPIAEHSLFTGLLIEALRTAQADNNSDGIITMGELALYLERNIYEYSSVEQTPKFGHHKEDKGGEMFLYYDPDELRVAKTRSELIKNDKEIYIVLPFRSSTPDEENRIFSSFIPEAMYEALYEYDKRKYEVIDLSLIEEPDSLSSKTPYKNYIEKSECTKYFSGYYEVYDNKINIKIRLHKASDHSILSYFPTIIWEINEDSDRQDLAFEIKKRVMGFIDNNQQVMDRITRPPDYEAYKNLKAAYDLLCDDPEKAREYMDKAIEIDPKYFRAYLAKAFSYVDCTPVNVFKALEEWEKFKDIDFELTYYEEERFKNLEYELRGDYEKLVQPKFELYKDFQTRRTFGDAIWYAYSTRNIAVANQLINIAESRNLDADFKNYIFVRKNTLEQLMEPIKPPQYYERFKREQKLIDAYPANYYYSKILFDCNSNCPDEIKKFFNEYNFSEGKKLEYLMIGGDILTYKDKLNNAKQFYLMAYELTKSSFPNDYSTLIVLQYKLGNIKSVISGAEKHLDSLIMKKQGSALRYYILAIKRLNEDINNIDLLTDVFKKYERFPGFGYYYLATIKCEEGLFNEANAYLKMAMENGVGLTPYRYNFDADFRKMWDDPEFKRLTRLKI